MADDTPTPTAPVLPWYKELWAIRQTLIIILTPLVLLPIPILMPSREASCAYVILIMAVYWMTEVLPMAVTALLPVVLMPWLDVMGSKQLCQNYLKDANMLFFAGLLVAVAVEKWGLHKRVALRVLMLVGSKPIWIILGFMLVTGFLSMWLSNTACAAMMIPIACAVLKELDDHRKSQRDREQLHHPGEIEMQPMNGVNDSQGAAYSDVEKTTGDDATAAAAATSDVVVVLDGSQKKPRSDALDPEKQPLNVDSVVQSKRWAREDAEFRAFSCALKLCVAYASNVGGTGTIIGCGPNIVLKGQADEIYDPRHGIDFTSWFIFCFPFMVINLFLAWLSLVFLFLGPRSLLTSCKKDVTPKSDDGHEEMTANAVIRREYVKLGRMTFAEIMVMIAFIVLALMWLSKKPGVFPGWIYLLPKHEIAYVTDSSVGITICVILFMLPSQPPNYLFFKACNKDRSRPVGPSPPLLDWPTVNSRMPWSVILLLGGGFALADACQESGLSAALGQSLTAFKSLPAPLLVFLLVCIGTTVTTFTSNVSTTTILIPITAELANSLRLNPLYLMWPVAISASFSYILPVSTPPNAIVYAYGDITMIDMIKTGLVNCTMHILVLMFAVHTWGMALFDFNRFPIWAQEKVGNLTSSTDFQFLDITTPLP